MINIQDAYSYFNNERLFADKWLEATTEQQYQSVYMATNQIKRLKLNINLDDNDVIRAICEQALYLIETQNSNRSKLIEQGVTSFSVEGLSESYDNSKIKNKICSEALAYLKPYMTGGFEIC